MVLAILMAATFLFLQGTGGTESSGGMSGQAIITVSAAVVALTQLAKWGFIPDRYGPVAVLTLSALGVTFWGWSTGDFSRASAFGYFAGFIAVATSAAGVFGFTRASAEAVTKATSPPSGAGGNPTTSIIALVLVGCLAASQLACGPPSKQTIQKLYAGAHVVTTEIQTNITLPEQLLAQKIITPDQLATVKKYVDQALTGAQAVEKGLSDALTAEKPSLGTLAPIVADIILNLRNLTSLVNHAIVQKFFSGVEIGLRVLGSYFALQISQARKAGNSDQDICRFLGVKYNRTKFEVLATAYDGARFEQYAAAL